MDEPPVSTPVWTTPGWASELTPAAGPPVPHRPWSTALLGLGITGGVPGVVGVVFGVGWFIAESTATPDPADGIHEPYGLVLGPIMAAAGLVAVAVAIGFTVATVRGRRQADDGRPGLLRGLAITAMPLGVAGALCVVFLMAPLAPVWLIACIVVPVMVLVTMRGTPPARGAAPLP